MIPLLDLQAQYRAVQEPLEAAVLDVLRSGHYVLGEPVRAFEEDFAAYCGAQHAITVNTGTSALHLALLAAGIGPGDEVITVPMTFVATVAAILYTGATPVLVDVDPDTFTMNPAAFEAAITSRTRAVLPVHLHGRLADMAAIGAIAQRHGIVVIEDAAQAHGAERSGLRAGAFGHLGCFSFYPGKNLGACGEGGAVVTSNPDFAERIRRMRDWGQDGKYNHIDDGFNYRLDTVQAAILKVKLPHLDAWTKERRRVAAAYDARLAGLGVRLPRRAGRDHVHHVYAIRVQDRARVQDALARDGIATGIHYPRPVHQQPAYASRVVMPAPCPVSETLAAEMLSLPIFPEMQEPEIEAVIGALSRILKERFAHAV